MLLNWLARKLNKKINALQKAIDLLNKALDSITKHENCHLKQADKYRVRATEVECYYQDDQAYEGPLKLIVLSYLERTKRSEEMAKEFTDMRRTALEELVLLEGLKKREIEALHHGALSKMSHFRFFF